MSNMIPTPRANRCIDVNRQTHQGEVCLCEACRARTIAAFAQDLAEAAGDLGVETINRSLALATSKHHVASGCSVHDAVRTLCVVSYPEWEHLVIHVQVDPVTEDQRKLAEMPPRGTA